MPWGRRPRDTRRRAVIARLSSASLAAGGSQQGVPVRRAGKRPARHRAPWPGRLRPRPHRRLHRKRHAGQRRNRLGDHRRHPALGHRGPAARAAGRTLHRGRTGRGRGTAPGGFEHRGGHLRAGQPGRRGGPDRRAVDAGGHADHHREGLPDRPAHRIPQPADAEVRADLAGRAPLTAIGQIARGCSSVRGPAPVRSPWSRATTFPATAN